MNIDFFLSYKQKVGGSTPSTPTEASQKCEAFLLYRFLKMIKQLIGSWLSWFRACRFYIRRVGGSTPSTPTKASQRYEAFLLVEALPVKVLVIIGIHIRWSQFLINPA